MVCCKQLLCKLFSFSLVNTTAITFSGWPFHTSHSHFLACPFSCLEESRGSYCLTAISQWERWSHSSCRVQVNSPHEEKKYEHWPEQTDIFLPSDDCAGKLRIRGRLWETEKIKDVWQSALLAVYEMGRGHLVLGRKWKNLAYESVRLSWHDIVQSNQGGDTVKIFFPFRNRRKYKQVKHKRQREINKERGWRVDYLWVHLRCASWSCCWSGLEVLIWVVTVYWSWHRVCFGGGGLTWASETSSVENIQGTGRP